MKKFYSLFSGYEYLSNKKLEQIKKYYFHYFKNIKKRKELNKITDKEKADIKEKDIWYVDIIDKYAFEE